eukprot:12752038-Prorocentrum_lima.AAC.1
MKEEKRKHAPRTCLRPVLHVKTEAMKTEQAQAETPVKPETQSDEEEQYDSPQQGSTDDSAFAA